MPQSNMPVTVIIVTYNSAEVIAAALQPLRNDPRIAGFIVVDNASDDSTLAIVSDLCPRAHIIRNQKNIGFGRACNQALEIVESDFVLLLNPDAVIHGDGIAQLLACADAHPNAAVIAPALAADKADPSIQPFRPPAVPSPARATVESISENVFRVAFVSAAVALWRMSHMRKVGFFDPGFFLFYEDDDLSIRTTAAGYDMLLVTGIAAQHSPGRSCAHNAGLASLKRRSSAWSSLYLERKHQGRIAAIARAITMLRINEEPGEFFDKLWSIWYFIRHPMAYNPHG